jgi:hypothetical protein
MGFSRWEWVAQRWVNAAVSSWARKVGCLARVNVDPGESGGDMEQPVAQSLQFGLGKVASRSRCSVQAIRSTASITAVTEAAFMERPGTLSGAARCRSTTSTLGLISQTITSRRRLLSSSSTQAGRFDAGERVLMPGSGAASWTLLGEDHVPVEPVER